MRLIDADNLKPDAQWEFFYNCYFAYSISQIDDAPTVQAVPIPDNATNGDVIKAVFPNDLWLHIHSRRAKKEWWNAPYKRSDAE